METFDVAHVREQGVDLIITLVDRAFGYKTAGEQRKIAHAPQVCASSAGLRGTVVPVWDAGGGRMGFFARREFHPFFGSISLDFVCANVNRTLTCSG